MKILIIYGTIEGHTEKVAHFLESELKNQGHESALFNTAERTSAISFQGIDKVILAASVHERRHPQTFEVFLTGHSEEISSRPCMLISVSLSAAHTEGEEEAMEYVEEMLMRTGLNPDKTLCVGGAIKLSKYDFYALQVLRHVVLRGKEFDASKNEHEFTDWDKLSAVASSFIKGTAGGA